MLEVLAGVALRAFFAQLMESLFGFLQKRADDAAQRDLGRLEAERNQAVEGLKLQQELSTIAAQPVSDDDLLGRLERGEI